MVFILTTVAILVTFVTGSVTGTLLQTKNNPVPLYLPMPDNWLRCPQDWDLVGHECLRLIPAAISWHAALRQCNGYGGDLLRIEGRNRNNAIGNKVLDQLKKWQKSKNDSAVTSFWIGYSCTSGSVCEWSNSADASIYDGYWAKNQPTTSVYDTACAEVSIKGDYRWRLGDCSDSKPFVCTTRPCFKDQFRCKDGSKCVPKPLMCDGIFDCPDLSDEQGCPRLKKYVCSEDISGVRGEIASPNHPQNYPPHVHCIWKITAPISSHIKIKFISLHVEEFDSVDIYDGHEVVARNHIGTFKGADIPKDRMTSTNRALIRLRSDYKDEFSGFLLQWKAEGFESCGGQLIANEKPTWFTSPMYPNSVPGKLLCTWVLQAKHDFDTITLQFMDIELGFGDWIQIWDGDTPTSRNLKGKFTQSNVPGIVLSSKNALTVRFKSLHHSNSAGFNASFWLGCYVMVRDVSATISSPGYGVSNYPHNLDCTWDIRHPQKAPLTMVFNEDFETEQRRDSVIIEVTQDGRRFLTIGTFSGKNKPSPVRSVTGEILVRFKSDFSVNFKGWQASFSVDCTLKEPDLPLKIQKPYNKYYNSQITYSCPQGYRLVGDAMRVCGKNGAWVTDEPFCKNLDCGRPPIVRHATITSLTDTVYGAMCMYVCDAGYTPSSPWNITCEKTGWSNPPTCKEVLCSRPTLPLNISISNTKAFFAIGDFIKFLCTATGYDLVGTRSTKCLANGAWSPYATSCERRKCEVFESLEHAEIIDLQPVRYGSTLTIHCDPGYADSSGQRSFLLKCLSSRQFDQAIPQCRDIDECQTRKAACDIHTCVNTPGSFSCICQPGYELLTATKCQDIDECSTDVHECDGTCNNTLGNYTCSCDTGYLVYDGATQIINGRKLIPERTCLAPVCPPLTIRNCAVSNSLEPLTNGSYLARTEVIVACKRGFINTGDELITCGRGNWTPDIPSCIAASCGELAISNGTVNFTNGSVYGSIATYSCNHGYRLEGARKRMCSSTMHMRLTVRSLTDTHIYGWSGAAPRCLIITCGDPPQVNNAIVSYTSTQYMSQASYTCSNGYEIIGHANATCLETGQWSDTPVCHAMFCSHPGVPNFGRLVGNFNGVFPIGTCIQFQCTRPGYVIRDARTHIPSGASITTPSPNQQEEFKMCCVDRLDRTDDDQSTETAILESTMAETFSTESTTSSFPWLDPSTTESTSHLRIVGSLEVDGPNFSEFCVKAIRQGLHKRFSEFRPQINKICTPSGSFRFQLISVNVTKLPKLVVKRMTFLIEILMSPLTKASSNGMNACAVRLRQALPRALQAVPNVLVITVSSKTCGIYRGDPSTFKIVFSNYVCPQDGSELRKSDNKCVSRKSNLRCLTCYNARSDEECRRLGTITECQPNQESCQTVVRARQGSRPSITKSCKQAVACANNNKQNGLMCRSGVTNAVCVDCCNGPQRVCNLRLPTRFSAILAKMLDDGPVWSRELPQCHDIAAPRFTHCPPVYNVSSKSEGQATVLIPGEFFQVFDNSPTPLRFKTDPPGLHYPYTFTKSRHVNITVTDASNNSASCVFYVHLIDSTPPVIDCPTNIIAIYYKVGDRRVPMRFPPVSVFDYSGINWIDYSPANGTEVAMQVIVKVTVTASDNNGNTAQCDFYFDPEPEHCPLWSLAYPSSVKRTCSSQVHGQNDTGYMCELTCPRYYNFVTSDDLYTYTCTRRGIWYPFKYVPDCSEHKFPNYTVSTDLAPANQSVTLACIKEMVQPLNAIYKALVMKPCARASAYFTVYLSSMEVTGDDSQSLPVIRTIIHIKVIKTQGIKPSAIKGCSKLITQLLQKTKNTVTTKCGSVTISEPDVFDQDYDCDEGHIFKKGFCLACTPGMMYNASTQDCEQCPVGYYQDNEAQISCIPCPSGHSTLKPQSTNHTQCLAICPPGTSSVSGLEPCIECPLATYQPTSRSTRCLQCPTNTSTPTRASTSPDNCRGVCREGEYGQNGLAPCTQCEKHFYQNMSRQSHCVSCPDLLATHTTGATDLADCIDIDQCVGHGCLHGASCINRHRFYECDCTPGYEGPRCEHRINYCLKQPCENGAICINDLSTYVCDCTQGYTGRNCETRRNKCDERPCDQGVCTDLGYPLYSCKCLDGYTGKRCDTRIDYCASSPCQNGGGCKNKLVGYTCMCEVTRSACFGQDTGFEGHNCTIPEDDCAINPCVNGRCIDRHKNYTCVCNPGYEGAQCEQEIDECIGVTCSGNGECDDRINSYKCLCKAGWTGQNCSVNIDDCQGNKCKHGGTCRDLINDYICICPARMYEGKDCSRWINYCLPSSPCSKNALRCEPQLGGYKCVCDVGWTGKNCDVKIDWCDPPPCLNGGNCISGRASYDCHCKEGFTDRNCSVNIDDCAEEPCQNQASCVDLVNDYRCECDPGWTGKQCETDIIDCTATSCMNGATCEDITGGFICHCATGYKGLNCSEMIDLCRSGPCSNGATCESLLNAYLCHCAPGYEGKTCAVDTDDCVPQPCENGGRCIDEVNGYTCNCSEEFIGQNCSQHYDDCADRDVPCANGGICIDGYRTSSCQCPARYSPPNCLKEKSPDFDLIFSGLNGSISTSLEFSLSSVKNFTVCLWVRFAERNVSVTFFILYQKRKSSLSHTPRITLSNSAASIVHGTTDSVQWSLDDGKWHNICISIDPSTKFLVYHNTEVVADKTVASFDTDGVYYVVLGQARRAGSDQFSGDISQVNIHSELTATNHMTSMNCTPSGLGDISSWLEYDMKLSGDVRKVEPAICGSTNCPPGYRGTFCGIKIDKEPPKLVSCPEDVFVINNKTRLNVASWTEPVFTDNVGVVNITQTHRPGEVFSYGEYGILYVASDEEGNSVMCSFNVYILPHRCITPPPPKSGGRACGLWTHGVYCRIQCVDNFEFASAPPPFYKCGADGVWDSRSLVKPFRFPACLELFPSSINLFGQVGLDMDQSGCTEDFRKNLKSNFIRVMEQLDKRLGLCVNGCSYDNVIVTCDTSARRKRASDPGVTITFSIPITKDVRADYAVIEAVKNGNLTLNHNATINNGSLQVEIKKTCTPGQVLIKDKSCVSCEEGTYQVGKECRLCPSGQYNDRQNQTSCQKCPGNTVTLSPGSTSLDDCYENCAEGMYYSRENRKCEACKIGYYQPAAGQSSCITCPNAQVTLQTNSTSANQCVDPCPLGWEINVDNTCTKCAVGLYRSDTTMPACQVCPYGFTTSGRAATSRGQCDLPVCKRGYVRTPRDKSCKPCARGTYEQKQVCVPCPKYMTTKTEGSVEVKQCIPVALCKDVSDRCHEHAVCFDAPHGFRCECITGYTGNGTVCQADICVDYCKNGGICERYKGQVSCKCQTGWTGKICNKKTKQSLDTVWQIVIGCVIAVLFLAVAVGSFLYCRKSGRLHKTGYINKGYELPPDPGDSILFSNPEYHGLHSIPDSSKQRESGHQRAINDYDTPSHNWKYPNSSNSPNSPNSHGNNVYDEMPEVHEVIQVARL